MKNDTIGLKTEERRRGGGAGEAAPHLNAFFKFLKEARPSKSFSVTHSTAALSRSSNKTVLLSVLKEGKSKTCWRFWTD